LGEEAFAAAWDEGRTMPVEQVIIEVLRKGAVSTTKPES